MPMGFDPLSFFSARWFRYEGYLIGFATRYQDETTLWQLAPLWRLNQVHGCEIVNVAELNRQEIPPTADGFFWNRPWNGGLVVQTADCVPLALLSPKGGFWLHVGWRGLANGILAKAGHMWRQNFGSDPVVGFVGPHIQARSFRIGQDAAQALKQGIGEHIFQKCYQDGFFHLSKAIYLWWSDHVGPWQGWVEIKDDTVTHLSYYSWRREKDTRRLYHVLLPSGFSEAWFRHWQQAYPSIRQEAT